MLLDWDSLQRKAAARPSGTLLPHEAEQLMTTYGLDVVPMRLLTAGTTEDEVEALGLRFPVAVKVAAAEVTHKAQAGGVVLDRRDPREVVDAAAAILAQVGAGLAGEDVAGVYVQEMVRGDLELVVGIRHDPGYGPMIGFGLGGWAVEHWADMAFRRAPLTERDVERLIATTRAGVLLRRAGGRFAPALADLRRFLAGASRLAVDADGRLAELEANPVVVTAAGAVAVDATGAMRALDPSDANTASTTRRPEGVTS